MMREAMLWQALEGGRVVCALCAHRCPVAPAAFGVCGVRRNLDGKLFTLVYGDVVAAAVDPIEKKPLYHFLPGTKSFSIATIGCNFRCGFCQNWQISQASKKDGESGTFELMPEDVVREALARGCRSVSYTYTEPTIFFEYAFDTARLARDKGLLNVFVTNGYMTAEALETIRPYLDAANVDLKAFNDETYKKVCKARLAPVLDTIRLMKASGVWVEVTTLVVPGLNDGEDELASIARIHRLGGRGHSVARQPIPSGLSIRGDGRDPRRDPGQSPGDREAGRPALRICRQRRRIRRRYALPVLRDRRPRP